MVNTASFRTWTERADRHAQPGSVERVYADTARAERQNLAEGAQEALFHAALFAIRPPKAPMRQADRLWLADEFAQRPREVVSAREVGRVLNGCGVVFLNWGHRRRAEETWQQVQARAERTREPELLLSVTQREGWLTVVDGHLEAALEAAERTAALGVELGAAVLGRGLGEMVAYRALLHLGRTGEALQGIGRAGQMAGTETTGSIVATRRALALARLGRHDEARTALSAFLRDRRVQAEDDGRIEYLPLGLALEAAVLLNDREAASVLAQRLKEVAPLSLGDNTLTCPARPLGAAAALLGEPEKAHAYYQLALETAGKIRFRPEIALTRLQLAELLLDEADHPHPDLLPRGEGTKSPLPEGEGKGEGDPAFAARLAAAREALSRPPDALRHEANGHLDFAIAEFREMKMQPSLERALRHKGLLKA